MARYKKHGRNTEIIPYIDNAKEYYSNEYSYPVKEGRARNLKKRIDHFDILKKSFDVTIQNLSEDLQLDDNYLRQILRITEARVMTYMELKEKGKIAL